MLTSQIANLEGHNSRLAGTVTEFQTVVSTLRTTNASISKKVVDLEALNAELGSKVSSLESARDTLRAELSSKVASLESVGDLEITHSGAITQLQSELAEVRATAAKCEERVEVLRASLRSKVSLAESRVCRTEATKSKKSSAPGVRASLCIVGVLLRHPLATDLPRRHGQGRQSDSGGRSWAALYRVVCQVLWEKGDSVHPFSHSSPPRTDPNFARRPCEIPNIRLGAWAQGAKAVGTRNVQQAPTTFGGRNEGCSCVCRSVWELGRRVRAEDGFGRLHQLLRLEIVNGTLFRALENPDGHLVQMEQEKRAQYQAKRAKAFQLRSAINTDVGPHALPQIFGPARPPALA